MVDTKQLLGILKENNMSPNELAARLGMEEKTLVKKIKEGTLGVEDAERVIHELNISNPSDIFFHMEVT